MTGRVILHIGAAKTGSSALQAAFVRNRQALRERGIYYPADPYEHLLDSGRALSGNALSLAAYLLPSMRDYKLWDRVPEWTPHMLAEDLSEAAKAGCATVLYSSEYLAWAEPERLQLYFGEANSQDARPEAVYLVRNFTAHAVSSFHQHVRQGRYSGTLDDYVRQEYKPGRFAAQLRRWFSHVGRGLTAVNVMHYDSCQDRLFPAFIEFAGFSSDGLPNAERMNSSSAIAPSIPEEIRIAWDLEAQMINDKYGPRPEALSA